MQHNINDHSLPCALLEIDNPVPYCLASFLEGDGVTQCSFFGVFSSWCWSSSLKALGLIFLNQKKNYFKLYSIVLISRMHSFSFSLVFLLSSMTLFDSPYSTFSCSWGCSIQLPFWKFIPCSPRLLLLEICQLHSSRHEVAICYLAGVSLFSFLPDDMCSSCVFTLGVFVQHLSKQS